MDSLNPHDWTIVDRLIQCINGSLEFEAMRDQFLQEIKPVIYYDRAFLLPVYPYHLVEGGFIPPEAPDSSGGITRYICRDYHGVICTFVDQEDFLGALSLGRYHSRDAFSEKEIGTLRVIAPHLANALKNVTSFARSYSWGNVLESTCHQVALGILITDQEGKELFINHLGRQYLQTIDGSGILVPEMVLKLINQAKTKNHGHGPPKSSCARIHRGSCFYDLKTTPVVNQDEEKRVIFITFIEEVAEVEIVHPIKKLTAREQQVASLVGKGLTNTEIAISLVMSPETVKKHLANIYQKLEIRNRSQLVGRLISNNG